MNIDALISTVFGIGRFPKAPGTAASLVAVLAAYPIALVHGGLFVAALGLIVGIVGIGFAARYANQIGQADPKSCVIDEVAGQWIALAFAPVSPLGFFAAFFFFRFFDIRKPWPVNKAETLPGGIGIMADDVVGGILAAACVWIFVEGGYLR